MAETNLVLSNTNGQTADAASATATVPGGVTVGMVLTVVVLINVGSTNVTISGGGTGIAWNTLHGMDNSPTNNCQSIIFQATAVSDSASKVITVSTSGGRTCRIPALLHVASGDSTNGAIPQITTLSAVGSSITFPSVVTTSNGWDIFTYACMRSNSLTACDITSPPAGMTKDGTCSTNYASGTSQHSIVAMHMTAAPSAGTINPGSCSATTAFSNANLYTVAIPPSTTSVTVEFSKAGDLQAAQVNNITATVPADIVAGAAMYAISVQNVGADTIAVSGGGTGVNWTSLGALQNNQNGANSQLYTATATASSAGSTVTMSAQSGTARFVGVLVTGKGMTATGASQQVTQTTTATSITPPPITITQAAILFVLLCARSSTTTACDWTALPTGFTEDVICKTNYGSAPQHSVIVAHNATVQNPGTISPAAGTIGLGTPSNVNTYTVAFPVTSTTLQKCFDGTIQVTLFNGTASIAKGYTGQIQVYGTTPGPNPPPPPPVYVARFAGDTNPKNNSGKILWGCDEFDKNPSVRSGTELVAPEVLAGGTPVGAIRYYYSGTGDIVSGGAMWQDIHDSAKAGRMPLISVALNANGQWSSVANGSIDTQLTYMFNRLESDATITYPVGVAIIHEPITKVISRGGNAGTEAQWWAIQQRVRGIINTVLSNLSLAACQHTCFMGIHTAQTYQLGGSAGGIDVFEPTDPTVVFHSQACDPYQVTLSQAGVWGTTNMNATTAWCTKKHMPLFLTEWAVQPTDPSNATWITNMFNGLTDGTQDIWGACYYNSDVNGQLAGQWLLQPGTEANTYAALLNNSKAVHFDTDLVRPDGGSYSRPS